jgi:hypothetical protein
VGSREKKRRRDILSPQGAPPHPPPPNPTKPNPTPPPTTLWQPPPPGINIPPGTLQPETSSATGGTILVSFTHDRDHFTNAFIIKIATKNKNKNKTKNKKQKKQAS